MNTATDTASAAATQTTDTSVTAADTMPSVDVPATHVLVPLRRDLYEVFRDHAAASGHTLAELMDDAVEAVLAEDEDDRRFIEEHKDDMEFRPFDEFVAELREKGEL